ncbi:MAG TPA: translocation/assembly module TamB domain-containing protein [Chitinispirillaceae bacterium]|nr:translocation/assembly module TamB domain-containing protein [Chitinispirillaceae bacterium]
MVFKKQNKIIRFLLRMIAVLFMAPLAISGILWLILSLPVTQRYILDFAEEQLGVVLQGTCSIGSFTTNMVSRIRIEDIVLKDRTGHGDSIAISSVNIQFSLLALFQKKIHVDNVSIPHLDAFLTVAPSGKMMIPALPDSLFIESLKKMKKNRFIEEWSLHIRSARVKCVNATYSDSLLKFTGVIKKAVASAEIYRFDSMNLHLAVPDGKYESPWWNGVIDTIGAMGILTFQGMTLHDILVDGSSTRVTGTGCIPFTDTGYWHFDADVNSDVKPVRAIYGYAPSFLKDRGSFHATASWDGTLTRPVLHAQITGYEWGTSLFDIPSLFLSGGYDGDSVLYMGLAAVTDLGKVICSTMVQTEKLFVNPVFSTYRAKGIVKGINIEKVQLPDIVRQYIQWQSGDAEVKITGCGFDSLPEEIGVKASLLDSLHRDDSLFLSASMKKKCWNVTSSWVGNSLNAEGTLVNNVTVQGTVNAILNNPDAVSKIFTGKFASGSLNASAWLYGNFKNPDFLMKVQSNNLQWQTVKSDLVQIILDKSNNKYTFGPSHISLSAIIDSIAPMLNITGVKGDCSINAFFDGSLLKPDIQGAVKVVNAVYDSFAVDSVTGHIFAGKLDSIKIDNLQLFKNSTGLKCNGEILLSKKQIAMSVQPLRNNESNWIDTGKFDLYGAVQGDSMDFSINGKSIDLSLFKECIPVNDTIKGVVDFFAHIGSSVNNPRGYMNVIVRNPSYATITSNYLTAQCELADSLITGDAVLQLAHSTIDSVKCAFTVPLYRKNFRQIAGTPQRPLKISIVTDKLNLEPFMVSVLDSSWRADGCIKSAFMVLDSGNGFQIDGNLNVDATVVENKREKIAVRNIHGTTNLSGTISAPSVNYYVTTGNIVYSQGIIDSTFFIGYATPDTLHCETARISLSHGGLLSLSGVVPVDKTDSLLLQPGIEVDFVVVKFPLRLISGFLPENLIQNGVAQGEGHIRIGNGRPLFNGYLNVDTAVIALEGIAPSIGPIDLRIMMKDDSLLLKKLNGKWGKGKIRGEGFAVWSYGGLEDLKVRFRGENVNVELIDQMKINISDADATIRKQDENFIIKGNVDVGATRFFRDIRITDFFNTNGNVQYVNKDKNPFLKNIDLQLKLNLLEDVVIDMNLGYFELGGDISITGDCQDPTYIGEIKVNSGYVNYLDRKFDITEGSFINHSPDNLNPSLDLKAQTEVIGSGGSSEDTKNYIIYLELSGTLDKPLLKLSEENGTLNEADIISILTLGMPLGSSVGSDLGERLKSFAGQSILGFGTRKLEQVLRLDRIEIQGDIFKLGKNGEEVKNAPKLTLSKRISPRLLLTYETVLGDLTRRRVSALFRITRRIFIKGIADNEDYGLDFIFKYSK